MIRTHQEEKIRVKRYLSKHSFFNIENRLAIVLKSGNIKGEILKMTTCIIKDQLSSPYQPFLNYLSSYKCELTDYLLSDKCNTELTANSKQWESFLDQILLWITKIKQYPLNWLLDSIFGAKGLDFKFQYEITTWRQVADQYFAIDRLLFPNSSLITTFEQLQTLNSLSSWMDSGNGGKVVQSVCRIINNVRSGEFQWFADLRSNKGEDPILKNLKIGMDQLFGRLIDERSELSLLLKVVVS